MSCQAHIPQNPEKWLLTLLMHALNGMMTCSLEVLPRGRLVVIHSLLVLEKRPQQTLLQELRLG